MIGKLINLLLFTLPFVVLPFGTSYFETPKVILAELTIQFILCYLLFKTNLKISNIKGYWPIFAVILLSLVQLVFRQESFGFFGNPFRLQGVFFLWNMVAFAFIVGANGTDRYPVLYPFLTLFVLIISAPVYGMNAAGRFIGSLGEPNAYAAAALFVFTLVFFNKGQKTIRLTAVVLILAVLFLSRSRSAMIGFGIEMLFYFLLRYRAVGFPWKVFIAVAAIFTSSYLPILDSVRTFENRFEIWTTALYAGLRYPLFGWGIGRAEEAIKWGGVALQNNVRFQYVDSAHNVILDWWLMGGIVGVCLMIIIIFSTLKIFIKRRNVPETAAFIGILTALWFNPGSVHTHVAFWYLVGRSYTR